MLNTRERQQTDIDKAQRTGRKFAPCRYKTTFSLGLLIATYIRRCRLFLSRLVRLLLDCTSSACRLYKCMSSPLSSHVVQSYILNSSPCPDEEQIHTLTWQPICRGRNVFNAIFLVFPAICCRHRTTMQSQRCPMGSL